MGNMKNTQGDTDFLHEQFCTGLRGKRQQVNCNNILKLLIFLFSENFMKRNAEVKKCKLPSTDGENKTLGFQFQPMVWLELILTETGPPEIGVMRCYGKGAEAQRVCFIQVAVLQTSYTAWTSTAASVHPTSQLGQSKQPC